MPSSSSASMAEVAGQCQTCGAVAQALTQRILDLEKRWSNFGYPVEHSNANDDNEPVSKKIKLEDTSNGTETITEDLSLCIPAECSCSCTVSELKKKISALEKQWKTYFGDLEQESAAAATVPPNPETSTSVSSSEVCHDTPREEPVAIPVNANEGWANDDDDFPAFANSDNTTGQLPVPSHSGSTPPQYKCPMCPTICHTFPEINKHMASIHSHFQNLLPCATCGEVFLHNKDRKRHNIIAHKSDFACPQCGKAFKQKQSIEEHLRSKHGVKTSKTCPECGIEIEVHNKFISHLLEHQNATGKKLLFQCQQCNKAHPRYFLTEADLNEHVTKLHVHDCFVCGQKFTERKALLAHKRSKH